MSGGTELRDLMAATTNRLMETRLRMMREVFESTPLADAVDVWTESDVGGLRVLVRPVASRAAPMSAHGCSRYVRPERSWRERRTHRRRLRRERAKALRGVPTC